MAVPVSENLEKCKLKNQKEQRLYQRVLTGLGTTERKSLHKMDMERLALMQQLQINRRKAMHTSLKQNMSFDERLTLMRRDISTIPKKYKPNLFERSKGFSKVRVQDDENDRNMYLSHRREKLMHATKSLSDVRNFVLTDDDVYVYYPIPRPDSKPTTVVTVSELNDFKRRCPMPTTMWQTKLKPTSAMSHSRYPRPQYAEKLKSVSALNFNQYTDGTMHLEERRLQQRQKEFVPPQVGHLPIHKRNHSEKAELIQAQIQLNPHLLSNVATLPAKNIKIYLPKTVRLKKHTEDNEEQRRFLKLKQEHQAQEYEKVMTMTSRFLGKEPSYLHLIQRPNLKKEEFVLLEHMRRKIPSFKTTAIIISWLTKSRRKAQASRNKEWSLLKNKPIENKSPEISLEHPNEEKKVEFEETKDFLRELV